MDKVNEIEELRHQLADAKAALGKAREIEERQGFLLRLNDALRPLADPAEIESTASRLLVEHLGANRAIYLELEGSGDNRAAVIRGQYARDVPPWPGQFRYLDFAKGFAEELLESHEPVVVSDAANDRSLSEAVRQAWLSLDVVAVIATSLIKGGKVVAAFGVHSAVPRQWTESDVQLVRDVADRTWDAVERGRAEAAIRDTEERQSFLLKLSDALRAEPNADAVAERAIRMLSEQLRLDRCYIASYRLADDRADILHQVGHDETPAMPDMIRLSDFPLAFRQVFDQTLVIDNVAETAGLSQADRRNIEALGLRALIAATLRMGEHNPHWVIVAVSASPRRWTRGEIALAEEVGERTWAAVERARAEDALRESEERFAQFANASASALWIRDAETLAMEYASPAMHDIYGIEPDALLGPIERWASLITPDDRDAALEHVETARQGEAVVHEFRIQRPSDKAFRWVRDTDFPLQANGHVQRIGGIAEDVTEAKLLAEHQNVLLLELQHRVRNIMAVIRSITARTGERAASVADYAELMAGRLLALARVQALLTRAANVSVGIRTIVHDEVSVQASHEEQYVLDGPDMELSPKAAEILTLALHELATNAVKYGALSVPNGKVTVSWETFEKRERTWLALDWNEEGTPERPPPTDGKPLRRGFGSELIEGRIPYELGGRGRVTIGPGGAQCHLEFPLREGASVLETGAPQRTSVFGGALDMTGEADLSGQRVLVVEDDFYLATDAARALEGAGAEVIGPCPDEESARAEIEEQRPDAVLLDINLGAGPSFKLAATLKDKGIPFVFTTGYDPEAIPAEFDKIGRLQKPMQLRQIVGAIARLVGKAE